MLINVFPLNWISYEGQNGGKMADLFKFLGQNLEKLTGSPLLDVIFNSFWSEQQRLIVKYCFVPFLIYLLVSLFYHTEFLL